MDERTAAVKQTYDGETPGPSSAMNLLYQRIGGHEGISKRYG